MNNKVGIFYNKQFNVLMISVDEKNTVNNFIEENGIAILKHNDEIIGFNVFDVEISIESVLCSENPTVINYLNKRLNGIYKLENNVQFRIGQIIEIEDIEGTHLHKCLVDLGNETQQIVCGAKNAQKDLKVVVATVGSWMPNGMRIVEGKLRGIDSFGMLCSAKELGIEEGVYNDSGIIELTDGVVGESFWGYHNAK
ncbi:YtpR family tRNA-binding protein [Mesoplasma photuris]|uniref:YtpR family tRNA-binding protein n=1 Tax=Mesoplasma photuris TaxID=217731 RepID=UPI0004E2645F|nr:hypothetical protein [Mesoplasma photuris]